MEETDNAELKQGCKGPNFNYLSFDREICFELMLNKKVTKSVAFSPTVFL
jgi:hypothetical protein